MLCRLLKQIYATPMIWAAYRHRGEIGDSHILPLRDDMLAADEWKAAANMLKRIRRAVEEDIAANKIPRLLGDTSHCWLQRLPPDTCSPWTRENADIVRVVLPLETNLQVTFEAPPERIHMEVGSLFWVAHGVWSSWLNFGLHPAVLMMCDFKLETPEEPKP